LQDISQFESSLYFNDQEKNVCRLAVAMTATPSNISDELYAALRQYFSEPELVELSAVISWENARARFNRTFAIAAEGFAEGQFCPMPEHAPSSR
jgi:4-carboxymuconolactone decarboxylase